MVYAHSDFWDAMCYAENDVKVLKETLNSLYGISSIFKYKKIIFNNPATIIIWNDGTKTVVKCQNGDNFDPEKGVALCFMKKALGNTGNFNNILKKSIEYC